MFHYFIPGARESQVTTAGKLNRSFLATVGLAETLADLVDVPADATVSELKAAPARGPRSLGGPGTLILPSRKYMSGPVIPIDTHLQTWREASGGKFWLGHGREAFDPRHLERKLLVGGFEVRDRIGHVWMVPVARAPQWERPFGTLPQTYTFDEAGQPVAQLMPEFQWLWDLAGEVQEWYRHSSPAAEGQESLAFKPIPILRLVQYALRILGVNYRLGREELNALHAAGVGMLDNALAADVCQASYGWHLEDEAKKKPPECDSNPAANSSSSKTGDGIPSAAPGTDQAEEH
jgi:hypothetical protein